MVVDFLTIPIEVFAAIVAVIAMTAGWMAFTRPVWGVLALLLAIPLQKTAGSEGVAAKFALADVFTFFTLLGLAVAMGRGRDPGWRTVRIPRQFLLGIVLFFGIGVASLLVTETLTRSAVEMISYVVNVAILVLIVLLVRNRSTLYRCLSAWEAGLVITVLGALVAVVLLFCGQFDTLLTNGPKVTSTFKKSGQLSSYITATIPLLWFNLRYRSPTARQRTLRRLLLVATLLALMATGSRTGFAIGFVVVAVLFGGRWVWGVLGRRRLLKLSGLALVVLIVSASPKVGLQSVPYSFQRAVSIAMRSEGATLHTLSPTRYYQKVGFEAAAAEYPLTGVGVGDFYSRLTSLAPGAWKSHEVHNTYLGVWAETGIVGALALLLFFLAVPRAAAQIVLHGRDAATSGLGLALALSFVALFLYGLTGFGLRTRHLWATFGLVFAAWNVMWREQLSVPASDVDGGGGSRSARPETTAEESWKLSSIPLDPRPASPTP